MAKSKGKFDFTTLKHYSDPKQSILERLTHAEIIASANKILEERIAKGNHHMGRYSMSAIQDAKAKAWSDLDNWTQQVIHAYVWDNDISHQKEYNKIFKAWYASHEGAKEVYVACSGHIYWWNEDNFLHDHNTVSGAEAATRGWTKEPRDYIDFQQCEQHHEGRKYIELNREQVFEEGDLVVLRKPFVGNSNYDPFWNDKSKSRDDNRYGTITEEGAGDVDGYRYGRGSRTVKVLWFGQIGVMTMPERAVKFQSRKGKKFFV
jgi:hypothetical protein